MFVAASAAWCKFPEDFSQPLTVIAIGSCNQQESPQPMWARIDSFGPDLWIWMGDNIYGDTEQMDILSQKYDEQFYKPEYQVFREKYPIIGTWDDHDFGVNNGGSWYGPKAESRDLALKFLEVPADDPRWSREGIYGAYTFGPEGQQVKIYLLDNRYFATRPHRKDSELIGDAQWAWLREELRSSTAQINLIVSGTQILPIDQPFEKWANFPVTRQRFLDFIRDNKIPGVVLASGDRHMQEISLKNDQDTQYPLMEITASGLTHAWGDGAPKEMNRFRVGKLYPYEAFGLLKISWEGELATITAEIVNAKGKIVNSFSLPLAALQPNAYLK